MNLCLICTMVSLHCIVIYLINRSGVIQRKYTITKALLSKAERSSFDRLRQQVGTVTITM